MERLKVFISHSTQDKRVAGELGRFFKQYFGFEVFLAHDDIDPSIDWNSEIIKRLKNSDILLPLISQSSKNSSFVNQEIGMALARRLAIFPISIERITPFGFIEKFQTCFCKSQDYFGYLEVTTKIFFTLIKIPGYKKYSNEIVNSLLFALCESGSFKASRTIMGIIIQMEDLGKLSDNQVAELISCIKKNYQVYEEIYVLPRLVKKLFTNHNSKLKLSDKRYLIELLGER